MRAHSASSSILPYADAGRTSFELHARRRGKRSGHPERFTVQVLDNAGDLADHVAAWDELAAAALEPNVFYESWMLRPAVRAFGAGQSLIFVLVYRAEPESRKRRLCGFFPVEKRRFRRGWPIPLIALWRHPHCCICTPLLHAGHARQALDAFLDWVAEDPRGASLIEFGQTAADGAFRRLLVDCMNARETVHQVPATFNRALLETAESADAFLRTAVSSGLRKELRRLRRRLAERGQLEVRALQSEKEFDSWLGRFLKLEAKGWKGSNGAGTAIALCREESKFFEETWRAAVRRDRLQMIGLFLDGRPIALGANILAGDGGYHFKICYDESVARFSPGVLLEIEMIRHIHADPRIRWMDSCAVPDHPMINRLWPGRRTMQTMILSTGGFGADMAVSLLPALRWAKRVGRRWISASHKETSG